MRLLAACLLLAACGKREAASQHTEPYFVPGNPACLMRHDARVWFPGQSYLFEEPSAYGRMCNDADLAAMLKLRERAEQTP